jgi:hypothetical protein
MSEKNTKPFSSSNPKDFDVNVQINNQPSLNGSFKVEPSNQNGPTFGFEIKPNGENVVTGGYKWKF